MRVPLRTLAPLPDEELTLDLKVPPDARAVLDPQVEGRDIQAEVRGVFDGQVATDDPVTRDVEVGLLRSWLLAMVVAGSATPGGPGGPPERRAGLAARWPRSHPGLPVRRAALACPAFPGRLEPGRPFEPRRSGRAGFTRGARRAGWAGTVHEMAVSCLSHEPLLEIRRLPCLS